MWGALCPHQSAGGQAADVLLHRLSPESLLAPPPVTGDRMNISTFFSPAALHNISSALVGAACNVAVDSHSVGMARPTASVPVGRDPCDRGHTTLVPAARFPRLGCQRDGSDIATPTAARPRAARPRMSVCPWGTRSAPACARQDRAPSRATRDLERAARQTPPVSTCPPGKTRLAAVIRRKRGAV